MKSCCCTAAVARGWNVGAGIHHDLLTHNSVISSSRQNQLLHSCALHSCIESAGESGAVCSRQFVPCSIAYVDWIVLKHCLEMR